MVEFQKNLDPEIYRLAEWNSLDQVIDQLFLGMAEFESRKREYLEVVIPDIISKPSPIQRERELIETLKAALPIGEYDKIPRYCQLRASQRELPLEASIKIVEARRQVDSELKEYHRLQKIIREEERKREEKLEKEKQKKLEQRAREERERQEELRRQKRKAEIKKQINEKKDELELIHRLIQRIPYFEGKIEEAKIELQFLESVKSKVWAILESDFLESNQFFNNNYPKLSIIHLNAWKEEFIIEWFKTHSFDFPPSKEQARCIGSYGKNFQVTARAGSGKTATSAKRALFLMKHCRIPANQILMLAFNNKAAKELHERIHRFLIQYKYYDQIAQATNGGSEEYTRKYVENFTDAKLIDSDFALPFVKTFHSLGYSIVQPENSIIFDGKEPSEKHQTKLIKSVLSSKLEEPDFKQRTAKFLQSFMKEDWEKNLHTFFEKDQQGMLIFQRSLNNITLNNDYVKSHGEKQIANFLFEHNITYKYEMNHSWSGINYKPDFTIKNDGITDLTGIVIEYFGMKGEPSYDDQMDQKRKYWQTKDGWELFELFPKDIKRPNFEIWMKEALECYGLTCNKLSEHQIWEKIEARLLSIFDNIISGFINRCRKFAYTAKELHQLMIDKWNDLSIHEKNLMHLVLPVYTDYLKELKSTNQTDFDGLLTAATQLVNNGKHIFSGPNFSGNVKDLKFIFLDEFQDFSLLYYDLIKQIQVVSNCELFCVGDDWQSINGFAGAELKYFTSFSQYFSNSHSIELTTNYRSDKVIVELGNKIMGGKGVGAISHSTDFGNIFSGSVDSFPMTEIENEIFKGDNITPILLRIISKELKNNNQIVILSRKTSSLGYYISYRNDPNVENKKGLEKALAHIRSFFPEDKQHIITVSTSHSYKGLEKKSVIIVDANFNSYPLIHPNWIFNRIFGDNLEGLIEEERRLFYVASTRAIRNLYLLSNSDEDKTEFLPNSHTVRSIDWQKHPPFASGPQSKNYYVVKISGNTFESKDYIKSLKFKWNGKAKYWSKTFNQGINEVKQFIHSHLKDKCPNTSIEIEDFEGDLVDSY